MKKLFRNKKFVEVVSIIICFLIITAIFYVISQCISGSIDITIGIN